MKEKPRSIFLIRLALLLVLLLGLAACGQEEPTATPLPPAPTATPEPVAQATDTPAPTATATATGTPAGPGPTFTPIPTATTAATDTPAPTPTPEAVALLSPEDFGDDRNPLTGERVSDPAVLLRRPIAIKISNSPPEHVRPQSGLGLADLVFEHATEGPITRFTAIVYSQSPPTMGPIRSARLIDVELPAMYDAALAYSGSSIGVSNKLFGSDFRSRILRSNEPGYYRTGEDKPWEHTLYGRPEGFWEALDAMGENNPPEFDAYMTFTTEPPEGGEAAGSVNIKYKNFTTIDWTYDSENGRYWRWVDGEPHVDANDDRQISAANVVLIYALHQLDMNICEFQTATGCTAFSTEIQIWGQGRAIIVRDGRQYEVTWKRENRGDMFTFWDDDGNRVPLQVGNSWFQVIPLHYVNPVTITE